MNMTKVINRLNSMLHGELAATETYQQALAATVDPEVHAELRHIHEEHCDAANQLRKQVHHFGGKPDQNSGIWGTFAKLVEGTARVFGQTAALRALKEEEKIGLSSYTDAVKDASLPEECGNWIRSQLLPQTELHITVLKRLLHP